MLQLYRLGLVERFRPHTPTGSAPWHYTLDEPGARLVAARQEVDFRDFPFKKARIFDVVGSPRLRHRVECNGFFARLTFACRRRGWRLEWTGERRAAAEWDSSLTGGPLITPDGKGRILAGEREVSFFLEYDRGTEHLDQLAGAEDRAVPARLGFPPPARRAAVRLPQRRPGARGAALPLGSRVHPRHRRSSPRASRSAGSRVAAAARRSSLPHPRPAPGAP